MSDATTQFPVGAIDKGKAVATLRHAIGCESVTGNEAPFAKFLVRLLSDVGVRNVVEREFLPGRPNVWGVRKGASDGPTLLLAGHSDVVHVRGWRDRWQGTDREDPFGGAIVDGEIWGARRGGPEGWHLHDSGGSPHDRANRDEARWQCRGGLRRG